MKQCSEWLVVGSCGRGSRTFSSIDMIVFLLFLLFSIVVLDRTSFSGSRLQIVSMVVVDILEI